jgi:hypothetical protein
MIRIAITAEAFEAIAATLPSGNVLSGCSASMRPTSRSSNSWTSSTANSGAPMSLDELVRAGGVNGLAGDAALQQPSDPRIIVGTQGQAGHAGILLADVIVAGGLDVFDGEAFASEDSLAELEQYPPAPKVFAGNAATASAVA